MAPVYYFRLMPHGTPLIIRVDDNPSHSRQTADSDGMEPVRRVECYSGYTLHERPKVIHLEDKRLFVLEMKDRWFGPDHTYFKVLADDGNTYLLRYDRTCDEWAMERLHTEKGRKPPNYSDTET